MLAETCKTPQQQSIPHEPSAVEPQGLPVLVEHLQKLLCDPHALRNDLQYGQAWTDETNAARAWLLEALQAFAEEDQARGISQSGWRSKKSIEAHFELARRIITAFFSARRAVMAKLSEFRQMLAEREPLNVRVARLEKEIARLEKVRTAYTADEEYGPALRVVDDTLTGAKTGLQGLVSTMV
jgi:hypothetical protein